LTVLCEGSKDEEIQTKVKEIERKHIVTIKPTLKNLALYEAFAKLPSKDTYTKTIGLVSIQQQLPPEYDQKV